MKNTLPVLSAVRRPRGAVKANGIEVQGWLHWETEENEFYQPDTFTFTVALSGLQDAIKPRWWTEQTKLEIELFAGFPADASAYTAADLESVFFGVADDLHMDADDFTMTVIGRDLTAPLVDHKTSEKYANLTASAIATKLAGQYGLTPVVTDTTTKVGAYYQIDHIDLKDDRTEWDLLTWLARQEGFAVFVRGKELHFQPKPDPSQDPYVFRREAATDTAVAAWNGQTVTLSRTLTVAKDIQVTVHSWNSKQKRSFSRVSTRRKGKGGGDGAAAQKYSYSIAGLTPDQAQRRADQIRDEIAKHEMKLAVSGPADNLLHIDDVIRVEGTDTAFDQTYFPDSISRKMSCDGGYSWDVSAKNHSPESEPAL